MGTSGISTGFPVLSQTSGQVAHVLLTRSPLGLPRCCHRLDLVRLACVKHAASVRPEPGSNSPSRSRAPKSPSIIGEPASGATTPSTALAPRRTLLLSVSVQLTMQPPKWLPALAFGFLCSVFKEQNRPTDTPLQKGDVRVAPMSPGLAWSGASALQVAVRAAVQPTRARQTCQGRPGGGTSNSPVKIAPLRRRVSRLREAQVATTTAYCFFPLRTTT